MSTLGSILHTLLRNGGTLPGRDLAVEADVAPNTVRGRCNPGGAFHEARFVTRSDNGNYRLGNGLGVVLALSVGNEHLAGALIDASGTAHCAIERRPTPRQLDVDPDEFLPRMRDIGAEVLTAGLDDPNVAFDAGLMSARIPLIGIAVAWPFPLGRSTVAQHAALSGAWSRKTMRQHVSEAFGVPLSRAHCLNDANAGAMAVAFDEGTGGEPGSIMCLHLAADINLGTVHQALDRGNRLPFIDARLVTGRNGTAGHIGHLSVDHAIVQRINAENPATPGRPRPVREIDLKAVCNCSHGKGTGHLNVTLGAEAFLKRVNRYAPGDSLVTRLREAHTDAEHDPHVKRALNETGRVLARALDGAVRALDPNRIVLAGALASEHIARGMDIARVRGAFGTDVTITMHDAATNHLAGRRGAGLAVLRNGVYRGFFEHNKSAIKFEDNPTWGDWGGWDNAPRRAGAIATLADSVWAYTPRLVRHDHVAALSDRKGHLIR